MISTPRYDRTADVGIRFSCHNRYHRLRIQELSSVCAYFEVGVELLRDPHNPHGHTHPSIVAADSPPRSGAADKKPGDLQFLASPAASDQHTTSTEPWKSENPQLLHAKDVFRSDPHPVRVCNYQPVMETSSQGTHDSSSPGGVGRRCHAITELERSIVESASGLSRSCGENLGDDPFVLVVARFHWEEAKFVSLDALCSAILQRSVLIKVVFELWGSASSYEQLRHQLLTDVSDGRRKRIRKFINSHTTFAFLVESFGKHLSAQEKIDRMQQMQFLFSGDEAANLRCPGVTLGIFEKWVPMESKESGLKWILFGRVVADRSKSRPPWIDFRLTERGVLGPTTLDNELAFLMANQARIGPGDLVLDPFCGTGSLLIAASYFKAVCLGSDIDARVLKGRGVAQLNRRTEAGSQGGIQPDIFANFRQYKLAIPDVLRLDIASWNVMNDKLEARRVGVRGGWLDAILADPPYGIRATVREVMADPQTCTSNASYRESKTEMLSGTTSVSVDDPQDSSVSVCTSSPLLDTAADCLCRVAKTRLANVQALISDLTTLASAALRDSGRLVLLFPGKFEEVTQDLSSILCGHPYLQLEAASTQMLTAGNCRTVITMTRRARLLEAKVQ